MSFITPPTSPSSFKKRPPEYLEAPHPNKRKRTKQIESEEITGEIHRTQQAASTVINQAPDSIPDSWKGSPIQRSSTPEPSVLTPPGTPISCGKDVNAFKIDKNTRNKTPLQRRAPYIQRAIAIKKHFLGLRDNDFPFPIQIGNKEVSILENIRFLGSGNYQDCYLVRGKDQDFPLQITDKTLLEKNEFPCTIQVDNEQITILGKVPPSESEDDRNTYLVQGKSFYLALKLPKDDLLKRPDGYTVKLLVQKELEHYPLIIKAFQDQPFFRVAKQYDLEILLNEHKQEDQIKPVHGCRLSEYIPNPIPNGPLPERLRERLKDFFSFCWENNHLQLDIQKDNLHIEPQFLDGEIFDYHIVLIDPVHPQDKFKWVVDQALESFAPKGSELYNYLDPRSNCKTALPEKIDHFEAVCNPKQDFGDPSDEAPPQRVG